jgi:hypothetical protein
LRGALRGWVGTEVGADAACVRARQDVADRHLGFLAVDRVGHVEGVAVEIEHVGADSEDERRHAVGEVAFPAYERSEVLVVGMFGE